VLPGALQIFGGEPAIAEREGGLVLEVDQSAVKAIAMACPQCSGGLLVRHTDDRVITCRYCNTDLFLPDELWRRLHPAKTLCAWTLTYTGELETLETRAKREQEAADANEQEQRAAAARKKTETDRWERMASDVADEQAARAERTFERRSRTFYALLGVAALLAIAGFFALSGH